MGWRLRLCLRFRTRWRMSSSLFSRWGAWLGVSWLRPLLRVACCLLFWSVMCCGGKVE